MNQELVGDRARGDILAESQVDLDRASLGFNKYTQGVDYSDLLALTRKKSLTSEQQQKLTKLALALNQRAIDIGKQTGEVANAISVQNPTQQINQIYNTFRDIVESGNVITTKQLVDKGLTESQADAVIERIHDVTDEAQDSKEYRGLPADVIAYAVLNNFLDANSYTVSDKSYLKSAVGILDKIKALQAQSSLVQKAKELSRADADIQALKLLNGSK